MEQTATAKIKKGTIHAVIIRADGTREDLGMIASSSWVDRMRIRYRMVMRNIKKLRGK